jgi:hypothetical protein
VRYGFSTEMRKQKNIMTYFAQKIIRGRVTAQTIYWAFGIKGARVWWASAGVALGLAKRVCGSTRLRPVVTCDTFKVNPDMTR